MQTPQQEQTPTQVIIDDVLITRAIRAHRAATKRESGIPAQPSRASSTVEVIQGSKFAVLRNLGGILRVYRLCRDNRLSQVVWPMETYSEPLPLNNRLIYRDPPIYDTDIRMNEWQMNQQSWRIRNTVRQVLGELCEEAHVMLKDRRLEVMVLPEAEFSVWAYFPVHQNRLIARQLKPKPETRVLLVLSTTGFEKEPLKTLKGYLQDHLGHVLLYLRSPLASNECVDAMKEWRSLRRQTQ